MKMIKNALIILLAFILTSCSIFTQTKLIKVEVDKSNLTKFLEAHPIPLPTERSVEGMKATVNMGLYRQCVLTDYLALEVPAYCNPKNPDLHKIEL